MESLSENILPQKCSSEQPPVDLQRWLRDRVASIENSIALFAATITRINAWEAELSVLELADDAELLELYLQAKAAEGGARE